MARQAWSTVTAAILCVAAAHASAGSRTDAHASPASVLAAGITVSPTSGLVTTEASGTAQFTVVLDAAPAANVTIGISSTDTTEATVSAASLTFTTANWSTPQTVTVTGVSDALIDGDVPYTIVTAAAVSSDGSYSGLNAADVLATNTDLTGLKGHWKFDANANDFSGNSYNGTLTLGASIDTTAGTNKVGAGKLSLDGSNDYVDLTAHYAGFSGLTTGTVSAWIKTSTANGVIFALDDTAVLDGASSLRVSSTGKLTFDVYSNNTELLTVKSVASVNDGAWHHVAATVDAGGNKLYIDGVQVSVTYDLGSATTDRFFDDVAGVDAMQIGRDVNNAGGRLYFTGLIDDVRVYDSALPAADIAVLASTAPTIAGLAGDRQDYGAGAGTVVVEQGGDATVIDIDSADFNTGTLTVSFAAGSDAAEDVLAIRNQGSGAGQIGVSGANVTFGGTTIGTFTGGSSGSNLVVTLNASANTTNTAALIRNITYRDADAATPTRGTRTIRFVLADGDGSTSASYDAMVAVDSVVIDNATSASANSGSVTLSHTVGSGSNRLLLVGVSIKGTKTVSSVTYGGVAMQQVSTITGTGSVWLYRLVNPTAGTADVVVTLSGSDNVVVGAICFENVDQGAPLGPAVTASGTGTTASVTVSGRTGDVVLDVVATQGTGLIVGGGQAEQWNILQSTRGGGSTREGASSVTMSWTLDTSKAWTQLGVSVRHASWTAGQLVTGTYSGNATDNTAITNQLGFEPDFLFVKGNTTQEAVARTATMNGDLSKPLTSNTVLTADLIQSFDAPVAGSHWGGFTVGTDARVNSGSVTYEYVALTAKAGEVFIGSYVGDGVDSREIGGVGFQPDIVWVLSDFNVAAVFRTSTLSGDATVQFNNVASFANCIQALQADGFQVGTDSQCNRADTTYHYVAWKAVTSKVAVGSYTGVNGNDDRTVTIASGFGTPAWLILKTGTAVNGVEKTAVSGLTTDSSCVFSATACATNQIQQLVTDGFQVGTAYNANGVVYYYTAFTQPSAVTAVQLVSFTAAREAGGAVWLSWRTGYESNNLGFHLYREAAGVRTRLTASPVAGSGLGARTGDYRYAWRDAAAPPDPVVYYLEDLDIDGTRVLHGPISPIPATGVGSGAEAPLAGLAEPPPLLGGSPGQRAFVPGEATPPRGPAPVRAPTAPLLQQWRLENLPAVKILVRARGWYRVAQRDLVAAGLPATIDPRRLQLFLRGEEQPLRIVRSAGGAFDTGAAIEFYGTGTDTPYTDTQVYWLIAGQQPARRVPAVDGTGPGAPAAPSYPLTVARADRSTYFGALRNGDAESWFGAIVDAWSPARVTLRLAHLAPAPAEPARLAVALQGVTESPDGSANHRVGVLVNDTGVGEVVFAGRAPGAATLEVSSALLREGDNTVTFVALGGEDDVALVSDVQLTYAHTYAADGDTLLFTVEGGQRVTVTGFTREAIEVIDVTDPARAVAVRGLVTTRTDGYALTMTAPGHGRRTLYAVTDATKGIPAAVRANQRSTWARRAQRADHLLITHRAFAAEVAPLAAWRRQQGWMSVTIDVEDLYDAFSYGEKTPQAIKDFLVRANDAWSTPPRYAVLVGDATSDPRNYSGLGDADFVPTKLIDLTGVAQKTASDDWFADVGGKGLPTLALVGRLSVRTAEQARAVVAKIVAYEREPGGAWETSALFVADANDAEHDFERQVASLAAAVPQGYATSHIEKGRLGTLAARAELLSRLNQGQRLVNYVGHGSTRVWSATADLFTADDAGALTNGRALPVVVAMNCLNGLFQGIYEPEASLAEALLRAPDGGAVAVWASSGATDGDAQILPNRALLRALLDGTARTLGEAVAVAKRATSNVDVRRTWILFGDPALTVVRTPQSASEAPGLPWRILQGESAGIPPAPTPDPDGPVVLYAPEAGAWPAVLRQGEGFRVVDGQWTPHWTALPADLNGDGREDVLLYRAATGTWMQVIARRDRTFTFTSGRWAPGLTVRVGRFDADGRDDLFLYDPTTGAWIAARPDGRGGFVTRPGRTRAGASVHVGDFSGDGLSDVLFYDPVTGTWVMALNEGGSRFTQTLGVWAPGWTVRVANLDGDGRADVFLWNAASGSWRTALARGAGRFVSAPGSWTPGGEIRIGDFDGDGRDDVLRYNRASGAWRVALNRLWTTTPFSEVGGSWRSDSVAATGDLDGDGRTDVFLHQPASGSWTRCLADDPGAFVCADGLWPQGWTVVGPVPSEDDTWMAQQARSAPALIQVIGGIVITVQ